MAVLTLGKKMKTTKRQKGSGRSSPCARALCRLWHACDVRVRVRFRVRVRVRVRFRVKG